MSRLADYLAEKNLTQRAFAAAHGWRQATISDWLTGKKRPNMRNALALERATGGAVPVACWIDDGAPVSTRAA